MIQPYAGIKLHTSHDGIVSARRRGFICLCCAAAVFLSLGTLLLWPAARSGVLLLINTLFAASEAANPYVYSYFTVLGPASPAAACALLCVLTAALCCIAVIRKSKAAALLFMLFVAGVEVYFGVTPPALVNVLIFALPSLVLLHGTAPRTGAVYLAFLIALTLIVSAAAAGTDARLETMSEDMRDRFDRIEQMARGISLTHLSFDELKTRQESRLGGFDAALSDDKAQNYNNYRHKENPEREISMPESTDYLKISSMLLLIITILLAPFAPFIIFDSRRRAAIKRRAAFEADDCAVAIRAMFLHMIACLESASLTAGNKQFSDCSAEVAAIIPGDCAESYINAVALWHEAAYSGHSMTDGQKKSMLKILEQIENIVYNGSDRKTRFRLKYIKCLYA